VLFRSGQNQLAASLAKQQVDNIRSRLAALRQEIRGANASRLSFKSNDNRSIAFNQLFAPDARGGAAGADSNTGRIGVFGSGVIGGGKHDKSQNEDGYKLTSRGVSFGSDYRVDRNTVAGAAIGFNSSDMTVDDNGGNLEVQGFSLLGYGSFYLNPKTYVEAIIAAYKNTFTAARIIEYDISGVTQSLLASSETNNGMLR